MRSRFAGWHGSALKMPAMRCVHSPTANVIQDAEDTRPALMLIAGMMPDGNGLELCRRIRENHLLARTPLSFLIPEAAKEDRDSGVGIRGR